MWTLPRIGAGNKIGEGPRETRRKSLRRQNFMAPGNNLPASSKGKERRVIREMAVYSFLLFFGVSEMLCVKAYH